MYVVINIYGKKWFHTKFQVCVYVLIWWSSHTNLSEKCCTAKDKTSKEWRHKKEKETTNSKQSEKKFNHTKIKVYIKIIMNVLSITYQQIITNEDVVKLLLSHTTANTCIKGENIKGIWVLENNQQCIWKATKISILFDPLILNLECYIEEISLNKKQPIIIKMHDYLIIGERYNGIAT